MLKSLRQNIYMVTIVNLLLAMLMYSLCRLEFFVLNKDFFPGIRASQVFTVFSGGLKFDLSAVLYTNMLYLLLMLIPLRFRYRPVYQKVAKWIFFIINALMIIVNCADSIYFRFTTRRTTASFFQEFQHDDNLLKIVANGMLTYWYVTLVAIVLVFLLYKLYFKPQFDKKRKPYNLYFYYIWNSAAFLLSVFLIINGMRGGFGRDVRPITLSNANIYVNKPIESAIVLNTPFCVLRTFNKKPYTKPNYFESDEELAKIFTPVVKPKPSAEFRKMNVVIFIIESLSKEFIGSLNTSLDSGKYEGYTPFLDSLIKNSLTFEYTFANGRKSIDAMPSVLSSIPRFYDPYILTCYSNNAVGGFANELGKKGYYSAFFHGAPNGSMGFEAFANVTGFDDYFGLNEYGNSADFDGYWGIWDEEFFQFFANTMSTFRQPFVTSLFSVSSHDPFHVPERYRDIYVEQGGHPIHKCIRYVDNALRLFFENAKKQDWYQNTIFVITADHTNALTYKEYLNDAGHYKVPIIFYTPNGDLQGFRREIAQQIDILPTVLGYLNYDAPFVAFGKNLLDSSYTKHYAINYNGVIQYFVDSLMLQFDGQKTSAIYDFVNDIELKHNVLDAIPDSVLCDMELNVKAIMQQYLTRMIDNRLIVDEKELYIDSLINH